MITSSNKDHIYIGREAGKEIHQKIKNARTSVKVVSPYLSPDYIKDLISLHKKGIKVTLVTCDKIENNSYSDFRPSDLIKKEKIQDVKVKKLKKSLFKSFIWLFIISMLFAVLAFVFSMLFIFAGIFLFAGIIALVSSKIISDYSFKYEPIFRIKVFDSASGKNFGSTELIHSKIFIIDEEIAFLGSINFTYSGFKTHYETMIKVEDKNAVRDISQEVENLYFSKDLKAKSVEEWAG
ncbi:MAG: phospholipase D-like domain-containing protein [Candidatus Pacearchaeota archaeon]|nr:phospholipase D-like domain-containing protein [Candidatus Pacearchaeota archaeon]